MKKRIAIGALIAVLLMAAVWTIAGGNWKRTAGKNGYELKNPRQLFQKLAGQLIQQNREIAGAISLYEGRDFRKKIDSAVFAYYYEGHQFRYRLANLTMIGTDKVFVQVDTLNKILIAGPPQPIFPDNGQPALMIDQFIRDSASNQFAFENGKRPDEGILVMTSSENPAVRATRFHFSMNDEMLRYIDIELWKDEPGAAFYTARIEYDRQLGQIGLRHISPDKYIILEGTQVRPAAGYEDYQFKVLGAAQ